MVIGQAEEVRRQSLDGKSVKGTSARGAVHHLVGLVWREGGLVLRQVEAAEKVDERKV